MRVVREKFHRTNAITDPAEREEFLANLYTFLVHEMQAALNSEFAFSTTPKPAEVDVTDTDFLRFAMEAESTDDFDTAAKYFQDCIARNKANVDMWYQYGCFCMRRQDLSKAGECFRECATLESTHTHVLLMAACIEWRNKNVHGMQMWVTYCVKCTHNIMKIT